MHYALRPQRTTAEVWLSSMRIHAAMFAIDDSDREITIYKLDETGLKEFTEIAPGGGYTLSYWPEVIYNRALPIPTADSIANAAYLTQRPPHGQYNAKVSMWNEFHDTPARTLNLITTGASLGGPMGIRFPRPIYIPYGGGLGIQVFRDKQGLGTPFICEYRFGFLTASKLEDALPFLTMS